MIGDLRSLIHGDDIKAFHNATQIMMQRIEDAAQRVLAAQYLNGVKHSSDFDVRTHNGHVTIQNPRTGEHRTFRLWSKKFKRFGDAEPEVRRALAVMVSGVFVDFAWVDEDKGITLHKAFRDSLEHVRFARLLTNVACGESHGLLYHIEGRCRVCNLSLTNPLSVRLGIGPICRGRLEQIDLSGHLVAA